MTINGKKVLPWLILILLLVLSSSVAERSIQRMNSFVLSEEDVANDGDLIETDKQFGNVREVWAPKTETVQPKTDFFIDYRLERDRMRSQQLDLLRQLTNAPHITSEITKEIKEHLLQITKLSSLEIEIESLIRAKGFDDAIVILHDDAVDVIVKCLTLDRDEALQLSDLVGRATKVGLEGIRIIPRS